MSNKPGAQGIKGWIYPHKFERAYPTSDYCKQCAMPREDKLHEEELRV